MRGAHQAVLLIRDRRATRKNENVPTGGGAIDNMADQLSRGDNWIMQLVVHLAGRLLLVSGRQLHLDDVRPNLSRDLCA